MRKGITRITQRQGHWDTIGLLDYPRDPGQFPPAQSYPIRTDVFGDDPAIWRQFNPIEHAEKLHGVSILLVTADEAFDRAMNEHFRRRLTDLGIPHRQKTLRGIHSFDVVREALPLVVEYTGEAFRAAAGQ